MYFEHVGGQSLGSGRFIFAEYALVRLHVGIQVSFQTPVVDAGPRTKRAAVPLFEVFPAAFALWFCRHYCRGSRHHRVHCQNGFRRKHHLTHVYVFWLIYLND